LTPEAKIAVKGIYSALAAAQTEMGPALKDRVNPAFKQKYAELSNVIDACLPALNKNGICVLQPICDEDGKRYVKTILAHESGETIECRVELILGKNDMQGLGSAITYGRRYGLMAMAGIAPEDDDGNVAAKSPPVMDEMAGFNADVSQALKDIGRENTLDKLAAFFTDLYRNKRAVAEDGRVVKAKDARKKALSAAGKDDLAGDQIPY
jgi:hypothetical protein